MMNYLKLFYHVVSLAGSRDFAKTVAKTWQLDEIEPYLEMPADEKSYLRERIRKRFPNGFNIWGVPKGCNTWNLLTEEDSYVLLVTSISIHDPSIRYGGRVGIKIPGAQMDLSHKLWGDGRFAYIYLFETEHLETDWFEFKEELGYSDKYRAPAYLLSVHPDKVARMASGAGLLAYLDSIRTG